MFLLILKRDHGRPDKNDHLDHIGKDNVHGRDSHGHASKSNETLYLNFYF